MPPKSVIDDKDVLDDDDDAIDDEIHLGVDVVLLGRGGSWGDTVWPVVWPFNNNEKDVLGIRSSVDLNLIPLYRKAW